MGNLSLGEAVLETGVDLDGLKKGLGSAHGMADDLFGKIGDVVKGGLVIAAGAATAAIGALGVALAISFKEAMEAQNNLAALDAVLRSTGQAAADQAAQWEAAQGKIVMTSGLSKEKTDELTLSQRKLMNQIAGTTEGLAKLAAEQGTDNTVYQEGALNLEVLKDKLAGVNGELEAGAPRAISMASALNLIAPTVQMNRDELLKLSMSLRDLAGGSDDAVLAIETVLLRFQSIGKDIFPQATETVLNLAAALATAPSSAAELLGRGLADIASGSLGLLARTRLLTRKIIDQATAMDKAGDAAGAQKLILDSLAAATGGAAAALAKTLTGQLEIAKNHLLEIAETVSTTFLPMVQDAFSQVMPLIDEFAKAIGTFLPVVKMSFENLRPHVEKFASALAGVLGLDFSNLNIGDMVEGLVVSFGKAMHEAGLFLDWLTVELPGAIAGAQEFFQPLIDALNGLVGAFMDSGPQIESTGAGMATTFQKVFDSVSPEVIANISGAINTLTDIWKTHGDTILTVVGTAWNGIVLIIGGALLLASSAIQVGLNTIQGILDIASQLLQGNWKAAWDAFVLTAAENGLLMLDAFNNFMEMVLNALGTNMETFTTTWSNNWNMLQTIVSTVTMQITSGFQTWIINTIISAKQFATDLIAALKSFYDTFVTIGQQWFEGIKQGILLKVTQLRDAVVSSIMGVVGAARETLEMASPSAVFADIGAQMMAGMGEGIRASLNIPELAMAAAMSTVTNTTVSNVTNFNFSATYANHQSEASLRDDIALVQMMAGA